MDYSENAFFEAGAITETGTKDEQGQHWYDQFLADFDYQQPKRGQVLKGQVLHIGEDAVLVDVGLKRDAVIPGKDLDTLDEHIQAGLSVGDEVYVYVIEPAAGDRDLLVSLSKGIEFESWEEVEGHFEKGTLLDLEVVGFNRGGLLVQYKTLSGFVPYSHVPELRQMRDRQRAEAIKRSLVGSQVAMKIIEVDRQRGQLVFSAISGQEERRQQRLAELETGQVAYGQVVKIMDFGVFVDLKGIDGLVHVSQLAWHRVEHPSDLVALGEEMEVQILDVNKENERVTLSRKALLPNPWDELQEKYRPGDHLEGRVTKVVDFGAFVELPEGVEGLVHISQLGYTDGQDPRRSVHPGDTILARVLNIDPQKERIALSMRQVPMEAQVAWALEREQA